MSDQCCGNCQLFKPFRSFDGKAYYGECLWLCNVTLPEALKRHETHFSYGTSCPTYTPTPEERE